MQGWKEGQVQMNVSQNRQSDISYDSAADLLDTLQMSLYESILIRIL